MSPSKLTRRARATTLVRVGGALSLVGGAWVAACTARPRAIPGCLETAGVDASRESVIVVAAGDLVDCAGGAQESTAALTESMHPDAVLALGDLVYPNATIDEYLDCYAPTWGRLRSVTHPVVGNHEYHTAHAGPYWA